MFNEIPKEKRLAELFKRLGKQPVASDHDEAMEQLTATLNAVEDELTSIPFDPDMWHSDGRIYPPQMDRSRPVPGHPQVTRYRSRAHHCFIATNGAIEIRLARRADGSDADPPQTGVLLFQKPGADGKGVWDL